MGSNLTESQKEERKRKREEYRAKEAKIFAAFKDRMEQENGLEKHPKKDILFQLAWDEGHACGYNEVEGYYRKFAVLLKD